MLVEGAFDRLTLVAAGLPAPQIVALVGTAVQVEWLPAQVKTVVLALDGDNGGKEASSRLPLSLPRQGYEYRSVHWGRRPWAKIGMSCGNTWDNRVLHLCLKRCLRHVLLEDGNWRCRLRTMGGDRAGRDYWSHARFTCKSSAC